MTQLSYCGKQARLYDFNRYLCSLFAPQDKQADLWALLAFQAEITDIKNKIHEPMMGQIRLQWWRDRFGHYPNWGESPHPVLIELGSTLSSHHLPLALFHQLIDAHESDFDPLPFPDQQIFADYCLTTNLPLLQLMRQILDPNGQESDFIHPLALAWGMINLWQSLPLARRKGICPIPLSWLTAAGLTPETLLSDDHEKHQALGQIFLDVLNPIIQKLPQKKGKISLPLFLQNYVIRLSHQRLLRYQANPLRPQLYQKLPLLSWRLLMRSKLS